MKDCIKKLCETVDELVLKASLNTATMASLYSRLNRLSSDISPTQTWKEQIESGYQIKGIEQANEDSASRYWIDHPSARWSGRDYVRGRPAKIEQSSNSLYSV